MHDIHTHICQSYPLYILYIRFYPSSISSNKIHNDIQFWYPNYIQLCPRLSNIDICIRYPYVIPVWYPFMSVYILVFIHLSLHGVLLCLSFFCCVLLFFCSNSLPISLNSLSYPSPNRGGKNCILSVSNPVSCALWAEGWTTTPRYWISCIVFRWYMLPTQQGIGGGAGNNRSRWPRPGGGR